MKEPWDEGRQPDAINEVGDRVFYSPFIDSIFKRK